MRREDTFTLGAVAYDPKVVTIWDGFRRFFDEAGFAFDYVLFTAYERQVEALFDGVPIRSAARRYGWDLRIAEREAA